MNRIIRFMLIPLLVLGMFTTVFATSSPNIMVNNELLSSIGFNRDGRVLVPLRSVSEALDAVVIHEQFTEHITIFKDDNIINLKINSKIATVNGNEISLDAPATIIGRGTTMVPIRFIGENLGVTTDWYKNTVLINSSRDMVLESRPDPDYWYYKPVGPLPNDAKREKGLNNKGSQDHWASGVSYHYNVNLPSGGFIEKVVMTKGQATVMISGENRNGEIFLINVHLDGMLEYYWTITDLTTANKTFLKSEADKFFKAYGY